MWHFLRLLNTEDKKYLYNLKKYPSYIKVNNDYVSEIWETIWNDYLRTVGDLTYENYIQNYKQYNELKSDFETLKAEIFVLGYKVNKEYIEDLRKRKIKLDMSSHEAYIKSLNAASKRINNIRSQYKSIESELLNKIEQNTKTDWEDFVISIEESRGFIIDERSMSAKKFAAIVKRTNNKAKDGKRKNRS